MDARIVLACLAAVALDAAAGGIYKCIDRGATTYQSMPCARGQQELPLGLAGGYAQAAPVDETPAPAAGAQPRKRGPWSRAAIEIGISDDEVLNMPGWGRPSHIARARIRGGWEEVWRYGSGYGGERELRFLNARLTGIVEAPAAIAWAR